MRIISDFRDYYDSIQATGQDQTLIFKRKASFLPSNYNLFQEMSREEKQLQTIFSSYGPSNPGAPHDVGTNGFVSVVNRIFPFVVSRNPFSASREDPMRWVSKTYWSIEQLQKDKDLPQEIKNFWSRKTFYLDRFWATKTNSRLFEQQQKFKIPIVRIWANNTVDINPQLHKMGFERHMSPPEIYQEISMFLGGLAAPEKEIVSIPDKYKVIEHGFDEWSFRKLPGEKKRKNKRKDRHENIK